MAPSRLARGRARPLETAHTHRNDHDVDVVDELRLVIGPMIVGRGRRLLDGPSSIQLELVRSETSPTGYLLVDYRVIR